MSIAFDPKNKWFYVKGTNQRLKGLHDVLARQFYPEGSCHANRKNYKYKKGKQKQKLRSASGSTLARPLTNRRAKGLGSRVDREMRILVEKCGDDPLVLRYWTTFKRDRTLADFSVAAKQKPRPLKKMEPYTAAGIQQLLDSQWMPVACQVPVGSPGHGIGTAVDVVCRHLKDKSRKAVVEVKVGYDGSWNVGTSCVACRAALRADKCDHQRFDKPLEDLSDTDRNKAHLQVACTALLEKAATGAKKLAEPYVLRISRTQGPQLEPLEPKIRDRLQSVATALVAAKKHSFL